MKTGDIKPFTEHRRHMRRDLDRVKATGRPLVVTTNGKPDAVVLSPRRYDQLAEAEELLRSLAIVDKSVEEVRGGRTRPMRKAIRQVAKDVGVKLPR